MLCVGGGGVHVNIYAYTDFLSYINYTVWKPKMYQYTTKFREIWDLT